MMSALGCKVFYYVVLILYHLCDIGVNWTTFTCFFTGTFAGAPINTTLLPLKILLSVPSCDFHEESSPVDGPFVTSTCGSFINATVFKGLPLLYPAAFTCTLWTVFGLTMIVVYGYYINFHCNCIDKGCTVSKHRCYDDVNKNVVSTELRISLTELVFKEAIKSGFLFSLCKSGSISSRPILCSTAFRIAVCSVVAHVKLNICFVTKLCKCGKGEAKPHGGPKKLACVIGILGSVVCLCFILTYLEPYLQCLKRVLPNMFT